VVELQKDPMTRGDFLGFGVLSAIVGTILTIPPVAFVLSPIIKTDVLGRSNVEDVWRPVGPVSEVPDGEPKVFEVEFPINQSYGIREVQEESGVTDKEFTVKNAIWLSWRDGRRPDFIDNGQLTQQQREQALESLNVLSNSCAHLGCPVRWVEVEGEGEFLCPCHGGIYDINGGYVGGPPPRGMYEYVEREIREDGVLYVKHQYDIENRPDAQQPYVV
jgi:Rieske Fe-S protein